MGQSTIVEWLNENEQRAFPLTTDASDQVLVNSELASLHRLIVDANIVFIDQDIPNKVEVVLIESDGTDTSIYISGDQVFTVTAIASQTYPVYVRNSSGSLLVLSDELKKFVSNVTIEGAEFEPSVVSEFRGKLRGVSSISFEGTQLTGAITLEEGYQTNINIKEGESVLQLGVGASDGIPLPCEDFFEDELDYDCDEIVSWVNGATAAENGGSLRLVAGRNIKIYEDTENHKIFIGLDFDEEDVCIPPTLPPQ